VDHHDHEAFGALSPADGRGAGIARYIRDLDDPRAAEIAVTIAEPTGPAHHSSTNGPCRRTTTMWHRRGRDHHDVASSWFSSLP
jgi:hypothetical protein